MVPHIGVSLGNHYIGGSKTTEVSLPHVRLSILSFIKISDGDEGSTDLLDME